AELDRVGRRGCPSAAPGTNDVGHIAQDGKELLSRGDVPRQKHVELVGLETRQVAMERVDEAVDALVRHRLALVTAAGEHENSRDFVAKPLEERAEERRLAGARN